MKEIIISDPGDEQQGTYIIRLDKTNLIDARL